MVDRQPTTRLETPPDATPTTRLATPPDPAPEAALPTGAILDGRYEVLDPLGRGGMAAVYRARDRRLDRLVALKILDAPGPGPAREDRVLAGLAHPHIVGVHDSGATPDGRPYLVLELVAGMPAGRLAPLPPARALRVAEQVAAALAHAHVRGVVHGDVTPQNVLLDEDGTAKLADFGVASAVGAPGTDGVYGAAPYLAPERLRGAAATPAADIYALGATLYQLLAGRPPYADGDAADVVAQVLAGPPAPLSTLAPALPPAVAALVARAMARDPAARFPSATALQGALAAARRATSTPGRATRAVPGRVALVALLVALLLMSGLGALATSRRSASDGAVGGTDTAAATATTAPGPSPTVGPDPTPTRAVVATAVPAVAPAVPAVAPPAPPARAPAPPSGGQGGDKGKEEEDKDKQGEQDKDQDKEEKKEKEKDQDKGKP